MQYLSFLIKPASSMCMLHCKYCFYNDVSTNRSVQSHGIMTKETYMALIEKACSFTDEDGEITFAFQGGEPTVAGLDFFKEFCLYVDIMKKRNQIIHYAIQTNGYILDDDWCKFFLRYHFLVGISLDGYKENHDYFRLTSKNNATYKKVMESIDLLRKYRIEFNVLTVLSRQLAKHPKKLYDFYKKERFSHIQLIPCLPGLLEESDPFSLNPKLFASFYKQFFDLWEEDFVNGKAMSIYLFDNIIPMFADIPPQQCGMLGFCSLQFVVEGDGSVYPCDFYVLDEYCGGNIKELQIQEIANNDNMQKFLHEDKKKTPLCKKCPFSSICRGNCKRMNSIYFNDDYCGYQDFLMYAYPKMRKIALKLRRSMQ